MRVDFYILPDHTAQGRLLLACRLAEKAFTMEHTVYIQAQSEAQAAELDDLLWTFRQSSFIPHALAGTADAAAAPVRIGWGKTIEEQKAEVLINLDDDLPPRLDTFQRVAEVVDQDSQVLRASRERFRQYRERGVEPTTHRLEALR
ncbi:MAG: DNA polymerase III subunit chi [Gammaproteobacteria bacterium]